MRTIGIPTQKYNLESYEAGVLTQQQDNWRQPVTKIYRPAAQPLTVSPPPTPAKKKGANK